MLPRLSLRRCFGFLLALTAIVLLVINIGQKDIWHKYSSAQIQSEIDATEVVRKHHDKKPIILENNGYMKNEEESDSNEVPFNEPRIRAAKNLLDSLRSTKINEIIHQMETVSLALISFANFEVSDSKAATYVIPKTEPIRKLKNLKHTLVHTVDLPINKSSNYDDIISVVKWEDNFTMVGGVNAPKKIVCRGTDGSARVQLLKGKDDLRQDAVMQQVFTIMNSLLRRNKETSKRKLNIRTYKVVPLSQRSGILEWCSNTEPLGVYLLGENKMSGAHKRIRPNDMSYYDCFKKFKDIASYAPDAKLKIYLQICEKFHPVFQYFFIENYPAPAVWFERRQAYIHSVATTSMVGYILGLGDRHVQNILVDKETGELIHIDFGIAFEQGRILPTPETVPFRLTRDIVAGMGVAGIEGVFRRCCEKTMVVMRQNQEIILTILEVLLYDPLYAWTVSPKKAYNIQRNRNVDCDMTTDITSQTSNTAEVNKMAERALMRLKHKLQGTEEGGGAGMSSVQGQVGRLLQQARDPSNLSKLYVGWSPFL